jgi:uroporphyrinogen III methyltransferase/synthase
MQLANKTIVITRAAAQSGELRLQLESLGARVIECPTIQIIPPRTWRPVDEAIRSLHNYQWLLFTSANAVDQFMTRMKGVACSVPIAAVGSATAGRLLDYGLKASLVPRDFRAEGLLEALPENLVGTRILLPRAEVAREVLPDELRRRGATLDVVTVYRTVRAENGNLRQILDSEDVDCVVFTSPSTIPDDVAPLSGEIAIAVLGPVTREAAQLLGLRPAIEPSESTIPALVAAIARHWSEK